MDFDIVLPHVMQFAPGCGEPIAVHHIRQAAIEFCQRTRLWRFETQIAVTEVSNDIVSAPDDAEIFEIEEALTTEGFAIDPISRAELKDKYQSWRTWTPGTPKYITQSMPDTVRLVPSFDGVVAMTLFLQPAEQAQALPDFLSKYAATLGHGALSELLLIPEKTFTNPNLAEYYKGKFEEKLRRGANAFMRGQQRARVRTTARFF